ncbi:unnamed protein product [Dibothriocephalus latus]|uniref:Ferlin C-terminal domain-containing protein n=1 Tax=Dibothriocephalus latus TaxID=60516 RepID=A0A3P6UVR2_DIBLA|nr:unnamed protein product [Dibothriocephalus latus]
MWEFWIPKLEEINHDDRKRPKFQQFRPDSSFISFLGPLNTLMYLIKYKLKWILIKLLIAFLFILIIFLIIYTSPGWISKKIWNA